MKYARFLPLAVSVAILSAPIVAGASEDLAKKHNCLACHGVDKKLVGPAFQDIAAKYKDDAGAAANLAEKITKGGGGVWGQIPMPPNGAVPDENITTLVDWVLSL